MFIKTGVREFDDLLPRIKGFLEQDVLEVVVDGEEIRGYRSPDAKSIWIRDHSDMMRAAKYFETDLKSTVNHFAATQAANGRIFDYFTTFPEKLPCEKENWTKYVRVPVEADVEYRFIKAAWLSWQACGDDEWIFGLLPCMEKALNYIFTNPQRVDQATGLVKRAYTIDTWDFAYTAGKHNWLQFQIDDNTFWGIFHGDNSGYYEALTILSRLYDYFGALAPLPEFREGVGVGTSRAQELRLKAKELKERVKKECWNGEFFTHFVKLTPVTIPGVDESRQLSMANPMSINRGIATHEMAVSIIKEYQKRKATTTAFAEWFSIDPPFPDGIFGDQKLVAGAYINGGIFPLAGGELAKAAFNHGFEEYGVSILKQYFKLISGKNETYLWYFPDGTPCSVENSTSPEAMPTDGWGSSAMAMALIEGLAGIEDQLKRFEKVRLSPRWLAACITQAEVEVGYKVPAFAGMTMKDIGNTGPGEIRSDKEPCHSREGANPYAGVEYQYKYASDGLEINLQCFAEVDFHILAGPEDQVVTVLINQVESDFQTERIEQSQYINFSARIEDHADIRINFRR